MMDKCKLKFHINDDNDDDDGDDNDNNDDDDNNNNNLFPVLEQNAQPMSVPDETRVTSFTHTHTHTGKPTVTSVSFYILKFIFFNRKTVR
jgi:hypothetical protein